MAKIFADLALRAYRRRSADDLLCGKDRAVTDALIGELLMETEKRGTPVSALDALRVEDVALSYLVTRRLGDALRVDGAWVPGDAESGKRATVSPLVEATGKAWDRLRRAMKEFETAGSGEAVEEGAQGLADEMLPILLKAEGILEEALSEAVGKNGRVGALEATR